ncbi:MAG TPA: bifunctional phosphoribosylaminoimidazolecarboxamide formyltransferase/IMP cyclohydrolase, partial [Candidatus Peregrinibacteria bacterium]|nr:bifunctional phosphoribosylaminoimidazolecarboxamide formyltransferase/IMP cyclohydrolase [Candidatus Peregrinibacteria bacterium]
MRVLMSVYDKTGIVEFATFLQEEMKAEILSTGGTLDTLKKAGLEVTAVEEYTGFPEMMEGRVKTLHPRIHGGILALREKEEHMEQALRHNIEMIDMVIVNLYPFQEVVARGADFAEVIENIDIGGPSMLRSAAKNHQHVAVVSDPSWYPRVMEELKVNKGEISEETRKELAAETFWKTANYDVAIGTYLTEGQKIG